MSVIEPSYDSAIECAQIKEVSKTSKPTWGSVGVHMVIWEGAVKEKDANTQVGPTIGPTGLTFFFV